MHPHNGLCSHFISGPSIHIQIQKILDRCSTLASEAHRRKCGGHMPKSKCALQFKVDTSLQYGVEVRQNFQLVWQADFHRVIGIPIAKNHGVVGQV